MLMKQGQKPDQGGVGVDLKIILFIKAAKLYQLF